RFSEAALYSVRLSTKSLEAASCLWHRRNLRNTPKRGFWHGLGCSAYALCCGIYGYQEAMGRAILEKRFPGSKQPISEPGRYFHVHQSIREEILSGDNDNGNYIVCFLGFLMSVSNSLYISASLRLRRAHSMAVFTYGNATGRVLGRGYP